MILNDPLVNRKKTRETLAQLQSIRETRYLGDYGACDALVDLENAFMRAELTERQAECVRLVYFDGLKQSDAAERLGLSPKSIQTHLTHALDKVGRYL